MARYCPLFSGSSGNSTYVGTADGGVLIDAGVSAKRIKNALETREIDPSSLRAILVTHEHTDHISGLRVLLKQLKIPVIATEGTLEALVHHNALPPDAVTIAAKETMTVGDLEVRVFHTPHDSAESCGFCVRFPDERTLAIATDMGCVTDEATEAITGCDLVHIESNHDVQMLECGPYPYSLKYRVLSNRGHLSNACCAALLPSLMQRGSTRFMLSHLSRENNSPLLAYTEARSALEANGGQLGSDFLLAVAEPESTAPLMMF